LADFQLFLRYGYQKIGANGNPNLAMNSVLRCAIKRFDFQMLFDPTKKEFDFPAFLIETGDCSSVYLKVVGQKYKGLVFFSIVELDSPQVCRVF
jgi:hypothetical protein